MRVIEGELLGEGESDAASFEFPDFPFFSILIFLAVPAFLDDSVSGLSSGFDLVEAGSFVELDFLIGCCSTGSRNSAGTSLSIVVRGLVEGEDELDLEVFS